MGNLTGLCISIGFKGTLKAAGRAFAPFPLLGRL